MRVINIVNWLVLLLLALLAAAVGVIGLLLLGGIISPIEVSPAEALLGQWRWIAGLGGADKTAAWIVCAALAAGGALLALTELFTLRPRRREPPAYLIRRDGLGEVTVARKSVRDLVQYEAAAVPGVREVTPEVRDSPQGLYVLAHTSLSPEVEAPTVTQQLQERVQMAVQRYTGLPVSKVQVTTQLEPLQHGGRRRVR